MIQEITLSVAPAIAHSEIEIKKAIYGYLSLRNKKITGLQILKRSIDARSRQVKVILQLRVFIDEEMRHVLPFSLPLRQVKHAPHVLIVGAGPAGLFAALKLISLGIKPIIIERGKDVRSRRRDLAAINKLGSVNPESNYCFGEGGAGTYSDGKLYTRSTKRGNVTGILQQFHYFGAGPEVLFDAHPHIGTNKLPGIISAIRQQIEDCGGEVHFNKKLSDIIIDGDALKGIKTADGDTFYTKTMILATGHSARDVFQLLHNLNIAIEAKPFALGVRIEHPQLLIDEAQYHCTIRDPFLPPASYSLVTQQEGKGVFSFCMCPGGIIAPAATNVHEIVVNGWSPSRRNNAYANSGTVVTVDEHDFATYGFRGPLAAMQYQAMVEQQCYVAGGGNLQAPAQRMMDFVNNKSSSNLPASSYIPGLTNTMLKDVLPPAISIALQKALPEFGKKMKTYFTNEAVLVATESRTSSPVRIPRHAHNLQHIQIKGLYPCAEGAGYAGGIISAAIDGENCAVMAVSYLQNG
jgi:uncharacterized protein